MTKRGVTGMIPAKLTPDYNPILDSLKSLPSCWVRNPIYFNEIFLSPHKRTNTAPLEYLLKAAISSGKKLQLILTPCPHPSCFDWQKPIGGPWAAWFRPDFRIWEPIKKDAQDIIDFTINTWESLGGTKTGLRFEWFNEPATGHVGGGDPKKEPKGLWSGEFHSFCNYLLVDNGGLNFRGYPLIGPTLSMFGQPEPERIELQSCPGGDDGFWWSKMQRRCVNVGIYAPRPAKSPEDAARMFRPELERIIAIMKNLPVPIESKKICIHEWYCTKPMLGYRDGKCDNQFVADCIEAIGEAICSYSDIEFAFLFAHHFNDPPGSLYEEFSCFSGPKRTAMSNYLVGRRL